MSIRLATIKDCPDIANLLDQLGYPNTESFLVQKVEKLLAHPDETLLVYEADQKAVGFISFHIFPQIGLKGDIGRISYLAVDEKTRGKDIGGQLVRYVTMLAKEKQCDRIEVHCHSRRTDAHRFYYKYGFIESPKYFIKNLKEE